MIRECTSCGYSADSAKFWEDRIFGGWKCPSCESTKVKLGKPEVSDTEGGAE